jgi:hypothetical protein
LISSNGGLAHASAHEPLDNILHPYTFLILSNNQGHQDSDVSAAVSAAHRAVETSARDSAKRTESMVRLLDILTKERVIASGGRERLEAVLSQLDLKVAKGSLSINAMLAYSNHLDARYVETSNPDDQEAVYLAARQAINRNNMEDMSVFEAEVVVKVHHNRFARRQEAFDLEECIKYITLLLGIAVIRLEILVRYLPILIRHLLTRFSRSQDERDLDAAIAAADRAYQIPSGQNETEDIEEIMLARGKAYRERYEFKRIRSDTECALNCLERIPEDSRTHGEKAMYIRSMMLLRDIDRGEIYESEPEIRPRLRKIADSFIPMIK